MIERRTRALAALATLTLFVAAAAASAASPASSAKPLAAPVLPLVPPPLRSGLDLSGLHRNVRPQDDLYRFAAGTWLATTEIPPDRSNYGTFSMLEEKAESVVRELVEGLSQEADHAYGSDAQKIGDFYASYMYTDRLAVFGAAPLAAEVSQILAIRTPSDVFAYMGRAQRLGIAHPLQLFVAQDPRNSAAYIATLFQSGLTMPDRDYYLATDQRSVRLRADFQRYVARLLALSGETAAEAAAIRVAAIESRIANHHWTKVQNRDPMRTYNRLSRADATRLAPGFDWAAFLAAAGLADVTEVNVSQPDYVRELARIVRMTPVADWRLYFRFRLLHRYAPYLSADFEQAWFGFSETTLSGVPEPRARWRRALNALDGAVGEMVGRLYVEKTFTPEARGRMLALVSTLTRAFEKSIDDIDWMSPTTRSEARRKLARFTVKIGYPERWRDYSDLRIQRTDLLGNVRRSLEFEYERQRRKLGGPIDRSEWLMSPQTVNAYYEPAMNEIVFPAAILQPPFFDPLADDAVNFGAIGGVIGHEISHGFDDQGRQYDGEGNLRDWWTFDDSARFRLRAGQLAAQYASYNVLDGRRLNGDLTLGENIGDLSGLSVAYKAYQLSLGDSAPPVIDGFTGPQRFFLGWAQIWRRKYRDEELRMRLLTDPHSPSEFRCNGVVTNMPEFHEAFGVKAGDRLYRPAAERVKIW